MLGVGVNESVQRILQDSFTGTGRFFDEIEQHLFILKSLNEKEKKEMF